MVVRGVWYKLVALVSVILYIYFIYTQQKSCAQMGFRVNPVLARIRCSKCYMSLFTDIILQQFDALKL